ncbi:N-acetyllactosaminide alpha-1,3-galactosyltransferase-like [Protopterus annectens]|uniref:N-acetyllactosaminide alpha-1,3-galactosyltransferase-like n=1 Tax=Protopterus annectens TaxID=7888 RepID=UPI001CF937AA|nr:N-acetyllactosaminide alpha-1,3-galactosyltransferase-like [Protopterus annectens]
MKIVGKKCKVLRGMASSLLPKNLLSSFIFLLLGTIITIVIVILRNYLSDCRLMALCKRNAEEKTHLKCWFSMIKCYDPSVSSKEEQPHSKNWFNALARNDVRTLTAWNAPILWEGTFNQTYLNEFHKKKKTVIGLTVFATGRYLEKYLRTFLISAEQFFMTGHQVIYYVFADDIANVPHIELPQGRFLRVSEIKEEKRWQDNSMKRMLIIGQMIKSHAMYEVDYIFCMDVDQVFKDSFGVETLGKRVAQIQAWFYKADKSKFTYERRPISAAYIAEDEGDFYYHAAVFGGTPSNVFDLVTACYEGIEKDKKNNVEAVWHDESHLNRYLLNHKPTLLLSPEYCWDEVIGPSKEIRTVRIAWAPKQYDIIRNSNE